MLQQTSRSARHGPADLSPSTQSAPWPPTTKGMVQHDVGHLALEKEQFGTPVSYGRALVQPQTTARNLLSLDLPTEVRGLSTPPPPSMPNMMLVQGIDPHEVAPPPLGRPVWEQTQKAHDEPPAQKYYEINNKRAFRPDE